MSAGKPNQWERWEAEAFRLGQESAHAAASWTTDGNTASEHAARVLAVLDDGDPAADDYLPARPDLSGAWADSPTPRLLFEAVTGLGARDHATWQPAAYQMILEALCEAWERGVAETFETACEAELRKVG